MNPFRRDAPSKATIMARFAIDRFDAGLWVCSTLAIAATALKPVYSGSGFRQNHEALRAI
jgi:hypothetical protein